MSLRTTRLSALRCRLNRTVVLEAISRSLRAVSESVDLTRDVTGPSAQPPPTLHAIQTDSGPTSSQAARSQQAPRRMRVTARAQAFAPHGFSGLPGHAEL
eukprot:6266686-Pyramimonas_sp.AAC.1